MKNYDFRKVWALALPVAAGLLNQQVQVVKDPNASFWLGVAALTLNHFINPNKPAEA